jgi:hypothetical protein
MRRLWFIVRKWARKFLGLADTPESIAAGAAIGVFVGFLPLYGFQMILGACLAAVARVNKVAAILPVWLTNPVTIPPVLYAQYLLGRIFVSSRDVEGVWPKIQRVGKAAGDLSLFDLKNTWHAMLVAMKDVGWEVLWPTLIGSFISSVILGIATYPLMLRWVIWSRRRREARRSARRLRLSARGVARAAPQPPVPADAATLDDAKAGQAAQREGNSTQHDA